VREERDREKQVSYTKIAYATPMKHFEALLEKKSR